ncbi:uncharacterized protein LOC105841153 isoform X2 [Monomorium pharaonis]|nr:uncharacterized protein LOC105841153 isoform X2 [Monomorium pharaonis]XP_036140442.1 uncharacterized protein LOC105841153 isoform X2 [Monomorium pharaonis]
MKLTTANTIHFFSQRITYYNGQWYCYQCKTTFQNLEEAQHHSKNDHSSQTETSDFIDKSIIKILANKKYKSLLKQGLIIRDVQQDYVCVSCQSSVSTLDDFWEHSKEENHQKSANDILKSSTKERDTNGKINSIQSDGPVNKEKSAEHKNKSNLLAKVQPIYENKLTIDHSNNSTQMTNYQTIASVPYALMQERQAYKQFVMQQTLHYGQWYCHWCKCTFQSLADVTCHLHKIHPDIGNQITNFNKFNNFTLLDTNYRKLLNNEIAKQNYFCIPCQCSLPSIDHFHEHSMGKRHTHMISKKKYIDANIISENLANKQEALNNETESKIYDQAVSLNVAKNYLIRDLPSNCKAKKENIVSSESYSKDSTSDNLQIEKYIYKAFCCLCDVFIFNTVIKNHVIIETHAFIASQLEISSKQTMCIMKIEEERNTIKVNGKYLDGIIWPKYTSTATKYICDQCNKTIEENDVINHERTVHENSMISSMKFICNWPLIGDFNIAIYYPLFKCSFCNEIIHGVLSLSMHFSKSKHKENIKLMIDIKRQHDSYKNVQIYLEPIECLSLISFENNGRIVQVKEQPVMYIKNHCTTFSKNILFDKLIYICFACQYTCYKTNDIIQHLCNKKHLQDFKNIFLTYNYIHNISTSKKHNVNKAHEVKSLVSKDASISDGSSNYNINKTQVNTKQHCNRNLMGAINADNKSDRSRQNKNNFGFFISSDIFAEINKLMVPIKLDTDFNKKKENIPNQTHKNYNQMYKREFLDFEDIMFTCNQKRLNEIKLNLQFFLLRDDKMLCLLCNNLHAHDAQTIYEHINTDIHTARLHKNSIEHTELLKELIKVQSHEHAKCFACNIDVCADSHKHRTSAPGQYVPNYKDHITHSVHKTNRNMMHVRVEQILKEFQDLWYSIQYFACVECKVRIKTKIQFMKHLSAVHSAVLKNKDNSMFEFCLTCATLWYKTEKYGINIRQNYQVHCQQSTHKYLKKNNDFDISLPLKDLLSKVNETTANLFKLSNDVLNDPKVIQLTNALTHIFKTHRLPVEVYIFGSRITGLALPDSDIDIYLNFGGECTDPKLIKNRSKQIQDCLRTDKNWDIELTLDTSRTPIIKVKHRLTGLYCDLSFINGLSVENSKFIRFFNMACPLCHKLTLFLKKWLLLKGLTGPDGITNYTLTWLVIFYFQVKFQIPTIATLIKSYNRLKIVSNWETEVKNTILINVPKISIEKLLSGFFNYYRKFDYKQFVICPLLGQVCCKRSFTEVSTLPECMVLYVAQLQNEQCEYFRIDSPMCVQDPFDLSHNLTKAVQIITLKRFKDYCDTSFSMLHQITTSLKQNYKNL